MRNKTKKMRILQVSELSNSDASNGFAQKPIGNRVAVADIKIADEVFVVLKNWNACGKTTGYPTQ